MFKHLVHSLSRRHIGTGFSAKILHPLGFLRRAGDKCGKITEKIKIFKSKTKRNTTIDAVDAKVYELSQRVRELKEDTEKMQGVLIDALQKLDILEEKWTTRWHAAGVPTTAMLEKVDEEEDNQHEKQYQQEESAESSLYEYPIEAKWAQKPTMKITLVAKINISISLEMAVGRKPKAEGPQSPEGEEAAPATTVVAARKGWRATARKLWGRLKAPKTKSTEVQDLTARIAELEQKLEQQGTASREQFLTLQSQLGDVLSVLLNTGARISSFGEEDGSAMEEGEVLDAVAIPVPRDSHPSEAAVFSAPDEVDGGRCEEGEPAFVAARVEGEGDPFDLRNLPARYYCCPPGLCSIDRKVAAAESLLAGVLDDDDDDDDDEDHEDDDDGGHEGREGQGVEWREAFLILFSCF
ncbi:hypothetical protein Dda_6115 [Drechslerella dactyloides]|uniref:Uncharacterized protein n=1 Tax=Drechslerella dactyloides TaxID=74499 RepID=A0AAD6IVP4_DREDA|nr:hypothetical protein Dda_6115 [Drechslerella dactyloides]